MIQNNAQAKTLTEKALLSCFLRTWLIGAAFNTRGMQNIGMAYSMDPALKTLYGEGQALNEARMRYVRHYNGHPFWAPLLVGMLVRIEDDIAHQRLPVAFLENIHDTTICTLSAIGDSFFGGSVQVLCSLILVVLCCAGLFTWAVAWLIVLGLGLLLFRTYTFCLGLRKGAHALGALSRWNMINVGQRIKAVNAVVFALLLVVAWPDLLVWHEWLLTCISIGTVAVLLHFSAVSREVLAILFFTGYIVYVAL